MFSASYITLVSVSTSLGVLPLDSRRCRQLKSWQCRRLCSALSCSLSPLFDAACLFSANVQPIVEFECSNKCGNNSSTPGVYEIFCARRDRARRSAQDLLNQKVPRHSSLWTETCIFGAKIACCIMLH